MKTLRSVKFIMMAVLIQAGAFMPLAVADTDTPETVVIENHGYQPDRKGSVSFSHGAHADDYEISCRACHHVYEDGVNVWEAGDEVLACNECHAATSEEDDMLNLKMAYHKNCVACHKTAAAEKGVEAPYNRCNLCHAGR